MWPEIGITEVQDPDAESGVGQFVCTGLLNPVMPLIRYKTGDLGALAGTAALCSCGRTLPLVGRVEGRDDDVLLTRDGKRVGRLDPVFKARLPVREAQIVQESFSRVRVRYVPGPAFTPGALDSLRRRLCDRLGQVDVVMERVDTIPRTARGKFRAVICDIPAPERQAVGAA
jgi:phenylacetate-CoA ligase